MSMRKSTIGDRLREARMVARWPSPETVSLVLGMGRTTVRDYESGRRKPGYAALRAILKLYKADAGKVVLGGSQ